MKIVGREAYHKATHQTQPQRLNVKTHLGLKTPGVYRIPCECGRVYIGQTGRSVDIRLKVHQWHIRLDHPDKSAVAEHSIDHGHRILFVKLHPEMSTRYKNSIVTEANEVTFHFFSMKVEGGFCLSKLWKPLICSPRLPGYDAMST
jgi:hypothetical protein